MTSELSLRVPQPVHHHLFLKRRTMTVHSSAACWSTKLSSEELSMGRAEGIQTRLPRAAQRRAAGSPVGTAAEHLAVGLRQNPCLHTLTRSEAGWTGHPLGCPPQMLAPLKLWHIPCLATEKNPETKPAKRTLFSAGIPSLSDERQREPG